MATQITNRNDFKSFCIDNKYCRWYFNIIDKALARGWTKKTSPVYVESHHIIPQSILKNNDTVILSAREHFICHLLLPKFLEGQYKRKMVLALHRLTFGNKQHKPIYVKNSSAYEKIKKQSSIYLSERSKDYWNNITEEQFKVRSEKIIKSNTGSKRQPLTGKLISDKAKERLKDKTKHPLYGVGHSEETKINMSLNAPAKKYYFVNDNQKIEVFNLRKFCRDNLLDQGAMTRVNSGKQINHKGYSKWQQ